MSELFGLPLQLILEKMYLFNVDFNRAFWNVSLKFLLEYSFQSTLSFTMESYTVRLTNCEPWWRNCLVLKRLSCFLLEMQTWLIWMKFLKGIFNSLFIASVLYSDFVKGHSHQLIFEQLPFDHPLVILYSSGTTGSYWKW